MTISCSVDRDRLHARVVETYRRLAHEPAGDFHFHRGPTYAASRLGYDAAELAALPARATERFAGVGNPLALFRPPEGATVLDHACGAGTDLLLAARRVGPRGRAIGVDLTPAMLEQAGLAAEEAGLAGRVELRHGDMESLPIGDASVDVVISNGVLNLVADKPRAMAEIVRVLRPAGVLLMTDVVVAHDLREQTRRDADLWAACIAGAVQPWELTYLARVAGLEVDPEVVWYDCFAGAPVLERVARSLLVRSMGFRARRA
jgi:arsenite methyltransferase